MTDNGLPANSTYVLGHAHVEVQRLLLQARLYDDHTAHALRLAGLRPGMRVLDVGCGPGDVSFVAARLVGPTGSVLGFDAASDIVELARHRANEQQLSMVTFQHAAIDSIALDEPVDAVIGRLILMHLPDPASALRQLATLVRPGGLVAFADTDFSAVRRIPTPPLSHTMAEGIARAFETMGLNPAFGATLYGLFQSAGLPAPRLTLAAPIGGPNDTDVVDYAVEAWRMVFPVVQQLGLATGDLAGLDGLAARLRDDAITANAPVRLPSLITAWSQVPDTSVAPQSPA